MPKNSVTYRQSGVDIDEADKLVDYLRTQNKAIGGFSGLMPIPRGYKKPLLVASTDGVGTKLLLAKMAGDYTTIGIDLVGMVVNDMLVCGGKPIFFLDYYATGKLKVSEARKVIDGILEGCQQANCPLIGGETAELPGLYAPGDFDLAGFGVGVVEADRVITGKNVRPGDAVFGIASSGLHSNGFSLARRVLTPDSKSLARKVPGTEGHTLRKTLLTPTRIYVDLFTKLFAQKHPIKALAHITGGGIPGNLNRVLPSKCDALIEEGTWPVPPIFQMIASEGPVIPEEMYKTFNMGLGMMGVIAPEHFNKLSAACAKLGETLYCVGRISRGSGKVIITRSEVTPQ